MTQESGAMLQAQLSKTDSALIEYADLIFWQAPLNSL